MFEGNCQKVVKATYCPKTTGDEMSPIIHGIHFMMQRAQGWQDHFVHRETNRVGHSLAKLACSKYGPG